MTISRSELHGWTCDECGLHQQTDVWHLLDSRDAPRGIRADQSGVSQLTCRSCGASSSLESPLLLIRLESPVTALMAIPQSDFSRPDLPESVGALVEEAREKLTDEEYSSISHPVPLPRALLPLVLTRDPWQDLLNPARAHADVAASNPDQLNDYGRFLQVVGWAVVNRHLSDLIRSLNEDDSPEAVIQARAALAISDEFADSQVKAQLAEALGKRLLDYLNQPSPENVEAAVQVLTYGLQLMSADDPRRASVLGDLATAYYWRLSGDPLHNWEIAADLFEAGCAGEFETSAPVAWSTNHSNYALLLASKPEGSADDDFRDGIIHGVTALEERLQRQNATDCGITLINLGVIFERRRHQGDDILAETCYRGALSYVTAESTPQIWATLQLNLAVILLNRNPPELDEATAAVESALSLGSALNDLLRGRLIWQLAAAETQRSGPLTDSALKLRHEASRLLTPELAPRDHLHLATQIVNAYHQLDDREAMAAVYEGGMLEAFDRLYDVQATPEGRQRQLEDARLLYRSAAFTLASVGNAARAAEVIERGRARELSTNLRQGPEALRRLADLDKQLADRYSTARDQYRRAINIPDLPPGRRLREVAEADRALRDTIAEVRSRPGLHDFLQPVTVEDIRTMGGGLPVVYVVATPDGHAILTVMPGAPGSEPVVHSTLVKDIKGADIIQLVVLDTSGRNRPTLASAQLPDQEANLDPALDRLRELRSLVEPIASVLTNDPHHTAIVVPTGLLGLVPIHAVPLDGHRALDDIGEVRISPSASVYSAARARARDLTEHHLVGLADTDPTNALYNTRAELAAVQAAFARSDTPAIEAGSAATVSWLIQHAPSASHLHLACHGYGRLTEKAGGHLRLGSGTRLSMDDLQEGQLSSCRLVVASACQSGHYSAGAVPDEVLGLLTGFLQAGAACVIATLWPVHDCATAILMARFYDLLDPLAPLNRQQPHTALRDARTWLRTVTRAEVDAYLAARPDFEARLSGSDLRYIRQTNGSHDRPFHAPRYWAAFTSNGY